MTRRRFGFNGSLAPATLRGSGVATGGPMENIRAAKRPKPWPRHDCEGQIDANKSSWEPPLGLLEATMASFAIVNKFAAGASWKLQRDLRARAGRASFCLIHYFVSSAKVATAGLGQLTGVPRTYRP